MASLDEFTESNSSLLIYTIGHSNHSFEKFVELLQKHNIRCIADVRSIPYSKHNQHFRKEYLSAELYRNGIEYIWMGNALGGRRPELQNSLGTRKDDKYDDDLEYRRGLVDLIHKAKQSSIAIMCSEEDPRKCHRHKIIAQTLLHKRIPEIKNFDNVQIIHIRGNGTVEDASAMSIYIQRSLFD